ncbi:plasmid mobilization protein [Campylobacter fetus]|uniref:plasmid mobilization protein n=1 Tax=Campylobacter fetus TaxID=196 RepID=UPI00203B64D6
MGFKKMSSKEDEFVNSARGETSAQNEEINTKRNKQFIVYFTDEELKNLKNTAKSIGMPTSTYIRFKLFS